MGTTRKVNTVIDIQSISDLAPSRTYKETVAWKKAFGKPTEENLKAFVKTFEDATKPNGVNAHLGLTVVTSATIRSQETGAVLATYKGPEFVTFSVGRAYARS